MGRPSKLTQGATLLAVGVVVVRSQATEVS